MESILWANHASLIQMRRDAKDEWKNIYFTIKENKLVYTFKYDLAKVEGFDQKTEIITKAQLVKAVK